MLGLMNKCAERNYFTRTWPKARSEPLRPTFPGSERTLVSGPHATEEVNCTVSTALIRSPLAHIPNKQSRAYNRSTDMTQDPLALLHAGQPNRSAI